MGSAHNAQSKVNIHSARDYAVLDSDGSREEGEGEGGGAGVVQLLTKQVMALDSASGTNVRMKKQTFKRGGGGRNCRVMTRAPDFPQANHEFRACRNLS